MGRFPSLKISQHKFPCWRVVEILILVALALASTLLIVFLPEARVYCGIALAVIIIYTFRLWRFLPSDRRRVKIEASRLADAALLSRRAGAGVPFVVQSVQAPVLHAASMQSAAMSFGHNSALHAQQMMAASWQQQQQQQQQVLMAHSMQLSQQQQPMVYSVFPPQQQVLMAHSMQLPQQQQPMVSSVFPPQQQALMAHSMQLPQQQQPMVSSVFPPQQQVLMAHSMQLPQQQQPMVSSVFPPQQQVLMAHSMQLPQQQQPMVSSVFPPQQQVLMAHSMQLPQQQQPMVSSVFPPQQQVLMAHSMQLPQQQQATNNFQTTVHSTRFTPPQPSPVPQMSMPVMTAQHAGDAGNTLPQQPCAHKNAVQFG